ncbi:hypothetical protein KP509_04G033400 [Ceratopteris richardii]|uniref:Uncharacterized protein n=1 Tax=Ceratopteris richardii TaxID=49495 RepID=A0A8T2UY66_CERRI|nr:hypothetical protein KP509_04G033400 [Ceratopteris richardii]
MGCGASKDCMADKTISTGKRRFIHASRGRLKYAASSEKAGELETSSVECHPHSTPNTGYIRLRSSPSVEEQGEADATQGEDDDASANTHFPVHEEDDLRDGNVEEGTILASEEPQFLENKPPVSQIVSVHNQDAPFNANARAVSPRNTVKRLPLRELCITPYGKPEPKKDQVAGFPIRNSSPRSNKYYSGISSSRPSSRSKSSTCSPRTCSPRTCSPRTCSPRNVDRQRTLLPIDADHVNDIIESPKFIKALSHEQFSKDIETTDDNTLEDMRDILENFDVSSDSLDIITTPRMNSWQSKLFETIERDIDSIFLIEEHSGGNASVKTVDSGFNNDQIDYSWSDNVELSEKP